MARNSTGIRCRRRMALAFATAVATVGIASAASYAAEVDGGPVADTPSAETRTPEPSLTETALSIGEPRPLAIGSVVERDLSPGVSHVYRIPPHGHRYLAWIVEQHGVDVEIKVVHSDGRQLVADGPFDRVGRETLLLSAPWPLTVEIRAREPGAPRGRYRLRVTAIDPSAPHHLRRLDAMRATTAAARLYQRGTSDAWREALTHYQRARAQWSAIDEDDDAALAGYAHAVLLRLVDRTRDALESAKAARERLSNLGNHPLEAYAWNEIGLDLWYSDESQAARDAYRRARELGQRQGDDFVVAAAVSNLCLMHLAESDIVSAHRCYEDALPIIEGAGAGQVESAALTNLGRIAEHLGEPADARTHYRRAIDVLRRVEDPFGEAQTRNNLGVLERGLGNLDSAMAHYVDALAIFESLDERRWQARVSSNIGYVYRGVNEPQRALTSFEHALALFRQVEDARGEAATLDNLGMAHRQLDRLDVAQTYHQQALELRRRHGHRRAEAVTLRRLAEVTADRGEPTEALNMLGQAAAIAAEIGDQPSEAAARRRIGEILLAEGHFADAEAQLESALALARNAGQRAAEAQTLDRLARVARADGRNTDARIRTAAAIQGLEDLRTRIASQDLRTSYSSLLHDAYALDVELTMVAHRAAPSVGHARRALAVVERARARALLEWIQDADIDLGSRVDPGRQALRRQLFDALRAKTARLAARDLDDASRTALEAGQQANLQHLDTLDAEIRRQSPAYDEIVRPRPLDAEHIQALVDPGTTLAVYFVGEPTSYLWRVTSDSIDAFALPGRSALEASALEVHRRWSALDVAARADDHRAAVRLAAMLRLDALVGRHAAKTRRVAIIADGALHLVPFAALPVVDPHASSSEGEPPAPLITHVEVVSIPSASVLELGRDRRADTARERTVAVIADPIYAADFANLPASRDEAAAIAATVPTDALFRAVGLDARRSVVQGRRLREFAIVHFATHGVIDMVNPALSGLVLSPELDDRPGRSGFLSLREIFELDLDAELVVLSGCRTALGPEVRGEGLIGLARGFMFAGSRRILASLWRVEDRATAALMARFYEALAVAGTTPATALAEAQRALAASRRFRDPFHWAGFVLMGDWR